MKSIKIPYTPINTKARNSINYPLLTATLTTDSTIQPLECLLDSGSDYNLISKDDAILLDIVPQKGDFKYGNMLEFEAADGHTFYGIKKVVKINVADNMNSTEFKTDIYVTYLNPSLPLPHHRIVLGRYGFFNHFKCILFNELRNRITLRY